MKLKLLAIAGAFFLNFLPLTFFAEAEAGTHAPLKVGFIYVGTAADLGWNNSHDNGRQYLQKEMKGQVETEEVENVPENSDAERIMEKMIRNGDHLIFCTAYGFLEPMLRVAKRHPDVYFMHCGRQIQPLEKNVGSYFAPYQEPLYASGIVAGRVTKTNNIGYVGGHPIPALLWCINAFTLGAKSVNPKVRVHVVWTNSWADAATEAESAKSLLDHNCDVIVSSLNTSINVAKAAEEKNAGTVSVSYDLHDFVPHGYLTGQAWNWGPLYVKIARSVLDGTWKPANLRFALKDHYVTLARFGPEVPAKVQKEANLSMQQMENGTLKIFRGPLKDRDGKMRLADGKLPDDQWLETTDWFVEGVEGNLPAKK
jgi:basic membrane protein A and related proteins